MKETKEGRDSMVYDLADIQKLLKIGRTASYDFIAKVYKEGRPFPVLKIGSMYRIPKERFDMWLSGKQENQETTGKLSINKQPSCGIIGVAICDFCA